MEHRDEHEEYAWGSVSNRSGWTPSSAGWPGRKIFQIGMTVFVLVVIYLTVMR